MRRVPRPTERVRDEQVDRVFENDADERDEEVRSPTDRTLEREQCIA